MNSKIKYGQIWSCSHPTGYTAHRYICEKDNPFPHGQMPVGPADIQYQENIYNSNYQHISRNLIPKHFNNFKMTYTVATLMPILIINGASPFQRMTESTTMPMLTTTYFQSQPYALLHMMTDTMNKKNLGFYQLFG